MNNSQQLHFRLILSLLIAFQVLCPRCEIFAQDNKPGATPAWTIGRPDAVVTIEVFNDYQCPPCARFNEELKKIEAEYNAEVRIVFRNLPLPTVHKNAFAAAGAAEAAGMQGKFEEMINLLYGKREQWQAASDVDQHFASYAHELGLDVDRFVHDMNGEEARERIRLDIERAMSLGVKGTPTVFVNGKEVGQPAVGLAIKEALGKAAP